jgi:signal recognition particle subunit SRP68
MARTYAFLKRYAEAVSLTQTAQVRIREARYQLSLLLTDLSVPETRYFPLSETQIASLERSIEKDENAMKIDWFSHNGGSAKTETGANPFKKPLFYDIAFNSIEDPSEKIQNRAGRMVEASKKTVATNKAPTAPQHTTTKAKVDEEPVAPEPEPEPEPARAGVLSGLLGGWWGRR